MFESGGGVFAFPNRRENVFRDGRKMIFKKDLAGKPR